jgi:hypothetical protein
VAKQKAWRVLLALVEPLDLTPSFAKKFALQS